MVTNDLGGVLVRHLVVTHSPSVHQGEQLAVVAQADHRLALCMAALLWRHRLVLRELGDSIQTGLFGGTEFLGADEGEVVAGDAGEEEGI